MEGRADCGQRTGETCECQRDRSPSEAHVDLV